MQNARGIAFCNTGGSFSDSLKMSRASHFERVRQRDALAQQLDLPRGDAREQFEVRERSCDLRSSEVRTLAAIGAFRILDSRDLGSVDPRHGELAHLKEAGLVEIRNAQFRDGE